MAVWVMINASFASLHYATLHTHVPLIVLPGLLYHLLEGRQIGLGNAVPDKWQ